MNVDGRIGMLWASAASTIVDLSAVDLSALLVNGRSILASIALVLSLASWLPRGVAAGWTRRFFSVVLGVVGLVLLWSSIPAMANFEQQAGFWLFASLAISACVATISAVNPVYSAIWFALALIGVAGIFMLQYAQFLGIATVAVYAGAIVVTFLFVLMLSQPSGHAFYDRVSWGTVPRWLAACVATGFVLLVGSLVAKPDREALDHRAEITQRVQQSLAPVMPAIVVRSVRFERLAPTAGQVAVIAVGMDRAGMLPTLSERAALVQAAREAIVERNTAPSITDVRLTWDDLRTPFHMARLGGHLLGGQWISMQVGGTLLLAALVGAIAIAARDSPHAHA
jgi:NADH-quinone oxidoreductase subunit J